MRISDWSSDVCSSDLRGYDPGAVIGDSGVAVALEARYGSLIPANRDSFAIQPFAFLDAAAVRNKDSTFACLNPQRLYSAGGGIRSEEHTSVLQSLMRISYAGFCLKNKTWLSKLYSVQSLRHCYTSKEHV